MDNTNSRSIGKGYGFYMPIAFGLLGLLIVGYVAVALLYFTLFKLFFETSSWWVAVLPVLAVGFWIFIFACILKGADDKRTKMRGSALAEVCKKINQQYLSKSDVGVSVGDYSGWLEISYDPKKSRFKI